MLFLRCDTFEPIEKIMTYGRDESHAMYSEPSFKWSMGR